MDRQRSLWCDREAEVESLWARIPEESRQEVVTLYARLIARVAKSTAPTKQERREELSGEDSIG